MLSDRYIRNIDWKALLATVLLAAVGLLFVYSATSVYGVGSEFRRQLVFVAVGLVALFIVALMDYRDFGRFAWIIYIASVLLLVAVRFIGGAAKGAQRWIYIGGFSLQPSEIAKLAVIIAIAKFFSEKSHLSASKTSFCPDHHRYPHVSSCFPAGPWHRHGAYHHNLWDVFPCGLQVEESDCQCGCSTFGNSTGLHVRS